MRRIEKGAPPDVVAELRRTPGADWGSVYGDQKEQLRSALAAEQKGLCAYCNQRLRPDATQVEHWSPRSDPGTDPFDWTILLAVCPGGTPSAPHCDRLRKDRALTLHPARRPPDPERVVRFLGDGRVVERDDDVGRDAIERLGLNATLLVRARRQALGVVLEQLTALRGEPQRLRALQQRYSEDNVELPPFPTLIRPHLARAVKQARARGRRRRVEG
jgi:uncharacterized protein (TIGR02646 family)